MKLKNGTMADKLKINPLPSELRLMWMSTVFIFIEKNDDRVHAFRTVSHIILSSKWREAF